MSNRAYQPVFLRSCPCNWGGMIWGIAWGKQREGTAQENESFKSLSTKSREQGHEQGEAAHVSAHAS